MSYNHITIENKDMNQTQPTPDNSQYKLVVKIMSPVILPTGIVGNILIILVLLRTRSSILFFVNYFTALAVTDLLILLTLLPKYVETYVHARSLDVQTVQLHVLFFANLLFPASGCHDGPESSRGAVAAPGQSYKF